MLEILIKELSPIVNVPSVKGHSRSNSITPILPVKEIDTELE